MANWEVLKAAVAKVIKTNGNQEITGQVLQSTLNNIISVLGENRTFVGIANTATAPGNPDGKVFYITNTAGTYPNFAGITVNAGELAILINSNNTWVKLALQVPTTAQVASLSSQVNNNTATINAIKDKVIYKDKDAWSADTIVPKGSIALAGYDTVKIGDGVTAFAKLANSLTNISTIELSELSSMFSVTSGTQGYDNLAKMLKGEFPMYFRVLTKNKVVGTLLLISDNTLHQVTQVLISHFTIDSLNSDYSTHIDSVITIAHRSFNVASSTLPVERGNWTSWQSISSGLEILPFSGATFENISFETTGYSGVVNTILFDIQNAVFYVATGLKNYTAWTDSSGKYKDSSHYNDGTRAKSGLFFNNNTGLVYESPYISIFDTDAIIDISNDNVLLTATIEKFGNAISGLQNKIPSIHLKWDFSHYNDTSTSRLNNLYVIKADNDITNDMNIVLYRYIPKTTSCYHSLQVENGSYKLGRGERKNTWTKCAKVTNLYAQKLAATNGSDYRELVDVSHVFSIPIEPFKYENNCIILNSTDYMGGGGKTLEDHIIEYIRNNYIEDNSGVSNESGDFWIRIAGIRFRGKSALRRKFMFGGLSTNGGKTFQYNRFALALADNNLNLISDLLRFNIVLCCIGADFGMQLGMNFLPINNKNIIL